MTWSIRASADYRKAEKEFTKKYKAEMLAVAANLRTLILALEEGANPEQVKSFGFVHGNYDLGLLSIDETGHGKKGKPKALRMYVWPSVTQCVLYVILLGDKSTQPSDITICKQTIKSLMKELPDPADTRQNTKDNS